MSSRRGTIVVSATYRPPLAWDIFSVPVVPEKGTTDDEELLTDGVSYNHNCRPIPAPALKALVAKKPELAAACGDVTADDIEQGRATGLVFVSERDRGLETLYVALRFNGKVKVMSLGDIYGAETFGSVRMEDTGGFCSGADEDDHSIVYVSTKAVVEKRRTPWTVVYRTNLRTGDTERLTPEGQYDLSPAVSPSGKKVAVANFRHNRWSGETEHLKTDIVVMNAHGGLERTRCIEDGGWPSWGSDKVIFFHRGIAGVDRSTLPITQWGVFRYDMATKRTSRVTQEDVDAMTPAAINESKVAVAIIRQRTIIYDPRSPGKCDEQYRHIEIFDSGMGNEQAPVKVTKIVWPTADCYSPFVLDAGKRIGYHRARTELLQELEGLIDNGDVIRWQSGIGKVQSPLKDVDLIRVGAGFCCPAISPDGSKLALVDNEHKSVWLADKHGMRFLWEPRGSRPVRVFSLAWNKNRDMDTLYVCVAPPFGEDEISHIYAMTNVSLDPGQQVVDTSTKRERMVRRLTAGDYHNACPSSNPEGTKIVFSGSRSHPRSKNLYIMEDPEVGEFGNGVLTGLTKGDWTDTQCQWSPREDWIVFSSTRDRDISASYLDITRQFGIFLVMAARPEVVVRVVTGGAHHPVFSPDGRSIAFTSDLAAVSCDPISMPKFLHAATRPYGNSIFSVDIDTDDIHKNSDIDHEMIHRVTHSRYEYSSHAWCTGGDHDDPNSQWNVLMLTMGSQQPKPTCPYVYTDGGESWHMTGHLVIPNRCCRLAS